MEKSFLAIALVACSLAAGSSAKGKAKFVTCKEQRKIPSIVP